MEDSRNGAVLALLGSAGRSGALERRRRRPRGRRRPRRRPGRRGPRAGGRLPKPSNWMRH